VAAKLVRLADFQLRAGSRRPKRRVPSADEEFSIVVEVCPPDIVMFTMTRALWSRLVDWLASQQVEMTIVPTGRPSPRTSARRPRAR
jgi:hypothetical protein